MLVVIVVLSLVAYRFTDAMTSDYRASVRTADMAQARAAAASGVNYARRPGRPDDARDVLGNSLNNPDTVPGHRRPQRGEQRDQEGRLLFSIVAFDTFGVFGTALRHHR